MVEVSLVKRDKVLSSWLKGSIEGHHILHVSYTRPRLPTIILSEETGRGNGGLDKHLGWTLFEDYIGSPR